MRPAIHASDCYELPRFTPRPIRGAAILSARIRSDRSRVRTGRLAQLMENDKAVLVYSTFPAVETAESVGGELVDAGLAACVNILPGMVSIYRWEGKRAAGGGGGDDHQDAGQPGRTRRGRDAQASSL